MSKISDAIGNRYYCGAYMPTASSAGSDLVFNCPPIDDKIAAINKKVLATEKRLMKVADSLADKLKISKDEAVKMMEEADDPCKAIKDKMVQKYVNHPLHYQTKSGLEAIDVIEAFGLNFNLGNACKYILRAGKKDAIVQELEKAKWYIEREIEKTERILSDEKDN